MKFLQKILFVVMISLIGGNLYVNGMHHGAPPPPLAPPVLPAVAHPILDLPIGANGTPGLVVGAGALIFTQRNVNGVANVNCLHVVVPNTPAAAARAAPGGNVAAARAVNGNIYFPRTGAQPAAAETTILSCANFVSNHVTDWYVRAFGGDTGVAFSNGGVVPAIDNAPRMGFTSVIAPVVPALAHIITVNMAGAPVNFAQQFWQAFRATANTPDGRQLLYRILIEVRRIDTAHGNRHCYASGTERVGGMSLTVTLGANTDFVDKENISFNQVNANRLLDVLQRYYNFLTTLVTLPSNNPVNNTPHFVAENAINVPGATTANDQFTHIQIPGIANADMYLPIDGHQPTTPNAVAWSCASIDNRENSPITEWYMQMFGVPIANLAAGAPVPAPIVQAGWTNNPVPTPRAIITFNAICNGVPHNNCGVVDAIAAHNVNDPNNPTEQIARINLFIREFRKIASTSVGRVLLYRILIEIRRHNQGGNVGCPEQVSYAAGGAVNRRNNLRSIEIRYTPDDFEFSSARRRINFAPILDRTTIIGKTNRGGYSNIVHNSDTVDISIFHEMLHWYHYLRYTNRYLNEPAAGTTPRLSEHFLGRYYWGALNCRINGWRGQNVSGKKWENGDDILDFEEVRTVLGVPYLGSIENYAQNYVQGDDLSENLYKMCIGNPLRFGYDGVGFYEDRKVINRVINACIENYGWYTMEYDDNIGFLYGDVNSMRGLGKCQIQ